MMNWGDRRLNVQQIKAHQFFYGADWNSLRHIEPPFVPHLQSITDTSYFPTDGLDNLPDQLDKVEGVGAEKDLAFLGYASALHSYIGPKVADTLDRRQIHIQTLYWWTTGIRIIEGVCVLSGVRYLSLCFLNRNKVLCFDHISIAINSNGPIMTYRL